MWFTITYKKTERATLSQYGHIVSKRYYHIKNRGM